MVDDWLIVDGYNVLRQIDSYRKAADEDLEMARARLVDDLSTLAALTDARMTVVFDGSRGPSDTEQTQDVRGVEVMYSRRGQTADEVIERLAHRHRGEHRVFVVTSDYAQQRTVFREGVYRRTPTELIRDIREALEEARTAEPSRLPLEERLDDAVRRDLRSRARRVGRGAGENDRPKE